MIVYTESGTIYEIDLEAMQVRRLLQGDAGELRRDGQQMKLLSLHRVLVSHPMVMLLDLREDGVATIRTTSPVTRIEEE